VSVEDDDTQFTPMSQERFEHLLRGICNQAARATGEGGALGEDARKVWHAAEFALGMLLPGYLPKLEAQEDARAVVERGGGEP